MYDGGKHAYNVAEDGDLFVGMRELCFQKSAEMDEDVLPCDDVHRGPSPRVGGGGGGGGADAGECPRRVDDAVRVLVRPLEDHNQALDEAQETLLRRRPEMSWLACEGKRSTIAEKGVVAPAIIKPLMSS